MSLKKRGGEDPDAAIIKRSLGVFRDFAGTAKGWDADMLGLALRGMEKATGQFTKQSKTGGAVKRKRKSAAKQTDAELEGTVGADGGGGGGGDDSTCDVSAANGTTTEEIQYEDEDEDDPAPTVAVPATPPPPSSAARAPSSTPSAKKQKTANSAATPATKAKAVPGMRNPSCTPA